ncbi:MAG: hypothetical protein LBL60_02765 [Mycoplasmataceae bacterium]|nr:hypothetical protein [Mycoplasmataceae bacterium]
MTEKTLLKNKEIDKTIQNLEDSLKIDMFNVSKYFELASCYQARNKYLKANDIYNKTLEIEPYNPNIYEYLGNNYLYLNDYDEALNCYLMSWNLLVDNEEQYLNAMYNMCNKIVEIYLKIDEYQECLKWTKNMIEINPKNTQGYLHMSDAYAKLNDLTNALKYAHMAFDIRDKNNHIEKSLIIKYYIKKYAN